MKFDFMSKSKYFFSFSLIIWIISIVFIFSGNINWGIDFTGGTKLELQKLTSITNNQLKNSINEWSKENNIDIGIPTFQDTPNNSVIIKMKEINNDQKNDLLNFINKDNHNVRELSYLNIGPSVSENLKQNAKNALIFAIIGIILYIAFAFRNVPKNISPWKFGIVAIIALIHDVFIMIGLFAIFNKYVLNLEIDLFFVTAVLTILGYSVNDTIVVFDRFRENLMKMKKGDSIIKIANDSINATFERSINTSITVVIVLISFLIIGPLSIKPFIIALLIGVVFGTYSSICIALPLLAKWKK